MARHLIMVCRPRRQVPSLSYSSQSEFRAFRSISFLGALFHVLAPFRSLTITLFTSLVWTNFQHFQPPPLPPACELIPYSVFLFLFLVGGGFSPSFAEEIFSLLYIGTSWKQSSSRLVAKFSPTKSDSVFISSANKCAATQSPWSRNARFSASFLPKKWLDIKKVI